MSGPSVKLSDRPGRFEVLRLDFRVYVKYCGGMMRKKKMGRPVKSPAVKYSEQVNVRMTKAERALLESEAERFGISLSTLLMRPWRRKKKGGG